MQRGNTEAELLSQSPALSLGGWGLSVHQAGGAVDALRNEHSAVVMEHSANLLQTRRAHGESLEAASEVRVACCLVCIYMPAIDRSLSLSL